MELAREHPLILAASCTAVAILAAVPHPARGVDPYYCTDVEPPITICADTVCVDNYRDCFFDRDGMTPNGYEQVAHFYANAGEDTDPPFGAGDRSCFQGTSFNPADQLPDADVYESIHFSLLLPVGSEQGPFPLFVWLRGGGGGWVNTGVASFDAWALEYDRSSSPPGGRGGSRAR